MLTAKRRSPWENKGPNKEISFPDLKNAIGPDVIAALEKIDITAGFVVATVS